MDILAVQKALKLQGFDPGPLDGLWGRLTAAAVKAFQRKLGIPLGLLTPDTERSILAASPPVQQQTGLVWFDEAVHLLGIVEKPGSASNPVILDWAKDLDLAYAGDDIPWCGLFVAHCVGSTLPDEPLPTNPLGARNWTKFGRSTLPVQGAVLVFWRESRDGGKGHVGFYAGEDRDTFKILGGNQSDRVGYARIAKNRLLGARWPRSAAGLGFGPVASDMDGVPVGSSEE
jgi:uncharacterized protein (TIGR02594 family)